MQKVKVRDIKVKTGVTEIGPRAGQKWELIIIEAEDGSEFTTFDVKAKEVGIGGVIELEPIVKGGKTNFTKFNILKKGIAQAPAVNGNDDSPEKRSSIENQSRAERITELWIAGKIPDEDNLVEKLRTWLEKLGGGPAPKTTIEQDWEKLNSADSTGEVAAFKNRGELLTRATKDLKLDTGAICTVLSISKVEEIEDLDAAWALLVEYVKAQPAS